MKNILIFGHSGFIGKNLYQNLRTIYNVIGLSSSSCNLLNKEELSQCIKSLDKQTIILFLSSIVRTKENNYSSLEKNIKMTRNLCEAIQNSQKVEQIIFFSSIDVYGTNTNNILLTETSIPNPEDPYSISKLTSEFLFKNICSSKNIPLSILRLPGIYGKNETISTLGKMIQDAKKGKIIILGDGKSSRDFLYIDDLLKIIIKIITIQFDGLLNTVTGKSFTITEISNLLKKRFSLNIEYQDNPNNNSRQKELYFDNKKLVDTLKFNQITSIIEAIHIIG